MRLRLHFFVLKVFNAKAQGLFFYFVRLNDWRPNSDRFKTERELKFAMLSVVALTLGLIINETFKNASQMKLVNKDSCKRTIGTKLSIDKKRIFSPGEGKYLDLKDWKTETDIVNEILRRYEEE